MVFARTGMQVVLTLVLLLACLSTGLAEEPAGTANEPAAPAPRFMSIDDALAIMRKQNSVDQLKLVQRFVRAARYDEALILLTRVKPASTEDRLYITYLNARIQFARGNHDEAIQSMRRIVENAPRFTEARVALAQMLYETDQDEAARHQFELLQGEAANQPGLARLTANYIDSIDRRRKFNASAYLSIAPSTNLNNGTDARVVRINGLPFTIDEESRRKSGVGLAFGGNAGYRLPISDRLDFITAASVNGAVYRESDFNILSASLSAGPKFYFNWGSVGAFVTGSLGYSGNRKNNDSWGGLLTADVRLSKQNILSLKGLCQDRSFDPNEFGLDQSYRDGTSCYGSARLEHFFKGGRSVRIFGGGGRESASLDFLEADLWDMGAGVYGPLPWGFKADFQVAFSSKDYKGIAPGGTEGRLDERWDFSLQLVNSNWNFKGIAPQFNYTYTVNNSNLDFYDYDRHSMNLTFTKAF